MILGSRSPPKVTPTHKVLNFGTLEYEASRQVVPFKSQFLLLRRTNWPALKPSLNKDTFVLAFPGNSKEGSSPNYH